MPPAELIRISKDSPAQYITSVARDRLPVFRTEALRDIASLALDEARRSAGFLIFAYVVMLDHLHLVTSHHRKPSETLRYINGIVSRRVIDYLKEGNHLTSLAKLRHETKSRHYTYSLWDHHSNVFPVFSERMLMEKVQYLHLNPIRAKLVERVVDYRWSSAQMWRGVPLQDEPLMVDNGLIRWRQS
jgi:REP element-mobilizing transposase RayT